MTPGVNLLPITYYIRTYTPPYIISHILRLSDRSHNTSSAGSSIVIGYKDTISGGSSIMQLIRIPENTRNVILVMNHILLISPFICYYYYEFIVFTVSRRGRCTI